MEEKKRSGRVEEHKGEEETKKKKKRENRMGVKTEMLRRERMDRGRREERENQGEADSES